MVRIVDYKDDKENNRVDKSKETKITSVGEIEVGEVGKRICYKDVSEISKVSQWQF